MFEIGNYVSLIITAILWGVTNVLIKNGSKGINKVKSDSKINQILLEIKFLFLNWKYLLPFVINQIGSLLYVYALQKNNLSIAVIVTNSLTLLITSITSLIVEKKVISYRIFIGAMLITFGSSICVISSQS
ncbi:CLUMA_CG005530, isoform A [Clunio marinus]|uniref:CLUMA_CG005530, isoform A n=1 Tax=Clunio marinus TaxID=568069 RepID=A0A1J1HZD7_9DIPT|nr:CLUMA_CG005530, isoform A [Clunio marinus]